jgi:hypothetical protein
MTRLLASLCLTLSPLAWAAPLPFPKDVMPPQKDVEFRGSHPNARLAAFAPPLVASEAHYRALAADWGIKDRPAMNFRTHVLVVTASTQPLPPLHYSLAETGEMNVQVVLKCGKILRCEAPAEALYYQLKSYPRRGLRTVNGTLVPAR